MELSVPFQFLVPKRQYYRDLDYIETFIDPIIMETINHLNDETNGEKPGRKDRGYTMLHACAEVSSDPRFLRDELITAMFAGRDNVAMALTWTLYELARHPDVVEDLRQVIQTTIGFDQKPTYENLKGMKMLSNIFSETFRLYPGVPINTRMCAKDTSLPRGGGPDGNGPIGVLAGTNVIYSSHMLRKLNPP
jgi:cytochrome P450